MSSFFRRPDEVTVSEDYTGTETTVDDTQDDSEEELSIAPLRAVRTSDTLSSTQSITRDDPPSTAVALPSAPRLTTGHRLNSQEILTRAALERSFIFEALAELLQNGTDGPYTKDHPEVKALAEAKYRQVTELLHQGGLLKTESKQESDLRPAFRAGLDLLSNSTNNARVLPSNDSNSEAQEIELFATAPRQSIDLSDNNLIKINQMLEASTRFTNSLPKAIWENLGHPMFRRSRYEETFEQIQLLGKGGFGRVYRVQHRLTQTEYAVKKIPVSAVRLRRIHERGKEELDNLYREVRVLSKLDHPNIVRFYDGWLEYSVNAMEMSAGLTERIKDVILGDDDPLHNSPRQRKSPPLPTLSVTPGSRLVMSPRPVDDIQVIFEESSIDNGTGAESEEPSLSVVSHSEIESIGRGKSPFTAEIDFAATNDDLSIQPVRAGSGFFFPPVVDEIQDERPARPQLMLHIQMGIHPLTLSDYLMPQTLAADTEQVCHCFHTKHSLSILLELLDGVCYMHARGIAHGDLKPSNVFLSMADDLGDSKAPLLQRCGDCSESIHCGPMSVCIGDFGLASEIAKPEGPYAESTPTAKAAGTALYRPFGKTSDGGESLDVYALGIIAAELLTPFQTSKFILREP